MDADLLPVLVHIQANLDADLDAEALARHSGMSASTIRRRILEATGETPRQHIERLRLERAAAQLQLRQATVLEIALDNGFASHEVFTRAFGRHFGTTPSQWRSRQVAGGLGHNGREAGLSEAIDGVEISTTRIVELRPVRVAFLRHIGPYHEVDGRTWGHIRDRLAELGASVDGLPLGIALDPPQITPPEQCRFDAAWTIDAPLPPECGLGEQTIEGGSYALTTCVGPFTRIGEVYQVIGQRLTRRPEMVRFGASIEWYRTGSIDEETYLNQVDITFPVNARADSPRMLE
jgi:AraC family transcriptional regulator